LEAKERAATGGAHSAIGVGLSYADQEAIVRATI